jgi:DnaA-homolog protein
VTSQLILELAAPPEPTFENFVGERHRPAVEALRAIATGPSTHSVIYLWGEHGSGRSHLLAAAARAAQRAGRRTLLAPTAATLARIDAELDVALLAIDDVDLLDAEAQVRVFDAFNWARARGAAFAATGRTSPRLLALREDLRTRLGSGLAFELVALDEEEKRAALRAHAGARGLALGDDVISYLLTRLRRDLGTQLAVLDAIDRYSLAQKRPVTLPLVREALDALGLR